MRARFTASNSILSRHLCPFTLAKMLFSVECLKKCVARNESSWTSLLTNFWINLTAFDLWYAKIVFVCLSLYLRRNRTPLKLVFKRAHSALIREITMVSTNQKVGFCIFIYSMFVSQLLNVACLHFSFKSVFTPRSTSKCFSLLLKFIRRG